MSRQTHRQFQETLWNIQKRWGDHALVTADTLSRNQGFATGFPQLDQLLSTDGLAAGQITELVGTATSGMTTLTLMMAGHLQKRNIPTVYLDVSQTFDPHFASCCGIDLEKLLLARPATLMAAFDLARDVVKIDPRVLLVIDAGVSRSLLATPDFRTVLKRLHEPLTQAKMALLMLLPSHSGHHDSFIHTRLQIERDQWLFKHTDVTGYRVRVRVLKDKQHARQQQTLIDLTLARAIDGESA